MELWVFLDVVVYQVVDFGWGFGRHSGRRRRSVASSVKGKRCSNSRDGRRAGMKVKSMLPRLKHAENSHVRQHVTRIAYFLVLMLD